MPNFAAEVKKQTDKILRQQKLGVQKTIIIGGDGDPIVVDPYAALNAHKTSGDHDGRYYTETEINALLNFLSLSDTPAAYTAQGGKIIAVKADETGLEAVAAPAAENGVPVGGTTNQLVAKNSDLDYDLKYVNAPEAANGLPAGGDIGQIISKKSATDYDSEWIAAPSGGLERWIIPAGTNLGYDDEFNDGALNEDWVAVDVSGYANSWYEPSGLKGLSCYVPSDKGAFKIAALLKPLDDLTYPLYIETAIKQTGRSYGYPGAGLIFTDGVTYGSGVQLYTHYIMYHNKLLVGRYAGFNSRSAFTEIDLHPYHITDRLYLRFAWTAANTFSVYVSCDGVVWMPAHTGYSGTITPTHFGLVESGEDASTYPYGINYGYFRARSGNSANG